MACTCHGKSGENIQGRRMPPDSQCLSCACKHLGLATEALHELSYEADNREYALTHLRLAMEHTKLEWRDMALRLRDVCVDLELGRDKSPWEMRARLAAILDDLRKMRDAQHPEIGERLAHLKKAETPDVIIPLGPGSSHDNLELRYLLRSIETNLQGYNRVFVVSTCAPEWLDKDALTVVEIGDIYDHNKDANLHRKTLETIKQYGVGWFIWCADDNAFMQPVKAGWLPTLHNYRKREEFQGDGGTWRIRVANTFAWASSRGVELPYNYECHAPQLFDGRALLEGMKGVDYGKQPGLTIYTTWRVVTDSWRYSVEQSRHKLTLEKECAETIERLTDDDLQSRLFLGYDDGAARGGILDRLARIFPQKSRFEK